MGSGNELWGLESWTVPPPWKLYFNPWCEATSTGYSSAGECPLHFLHISYHTYHISHHCTPTWKSYRPKCVACRARPSWDRAARRPRSRSTERSCHRRCNRTGHTTTQLVTRWPGDPVTQFLIPPTHHAHTWSLVTWRQQSDATPSRLTLHLIPHPDIAPLYVPRWIIPLAAT